MLMAKVKSSLAEFAEHFDKIIFFIDPFNQRVVESRPQLLKLPFSFQGDILD